MDGPGVVGGRGQPPLGSADPDALDGVGAVAFQAELIVGVEDGLDPLALSGLSCFRRLQVRRDRDAGRWFAFVLVACAVVCFNRLQPVAGVTRCPSRPSGRCEEPCRALEVECCTQ